RRHGTRVSGETLGDAALDARELGALARGCRAQAEREARSAAGLARHVDAAAHRVRELLHDREAETGADGTLVAVARVEVEALERVRQLVGREPGAGVLDAELAGPAADRDRAARRGQAQGVLDQVR